MRAFLLILAAEQVFNDQEYAIRKLKGRIGELTIYNAALNIDEIRRLFEQGRRN